MSVLRVFGVPISQPVRAVIWPCLMRSVPFRLEMVAPYSEGKRGALNPQYRAMNPAGTVPAIEDDGFHLGESHAILLYLAEKHNWVDLYPSNLEQRARINMYLHYHHRNTREASAVFCGPLFNASMYNLPPVVKERGIETLRKTVGILDEYWLAHSDFLVGDSPTLADIAAYCELGQLLPRYGNLFDFSKHDKILQWVGRMQQLPYHDEVHAALDVLGDMSRRNGEPFAMEKLIEANKAAFKTLQPFFK